MAPPLTLTLSRSSFQIADELLGHDRERFVDLEQVDVGDARPAFLQHLAGRRHRRVQHQRRAIAHVGGRPPPWRAASDYVLGVGFEASSSAPAPSTTPDELPA
jgi:hypothetical protein